MGSANFIAFVFPKPAKIRYVGFIGKCCKRKRTVTFEWLIE